MVARAALSLARCPASYPALGRVFCLALCLVVRQVFCLSVVGASGMVWRAGAAGSGPA
jgi:hypothetical protein